MTGEDVAAVVGVVLVSLYLGYWVVNPIISKWEAHRRDEDYLAELNHKLKRKKDKED